MAQVFCYVIQMLPGTMTTPVRDQRFSTTLAHGLELLGSFRVGEPALSNRQFAERTGLSKATVSRLTYTLAEIGFLKHDFEQRKYRLGAAALSVSYPLLSSLRVRQIARPMMRELANAARGSVSLGMRDRTNMVYIETSRGHDAITFRPDIGASLHIVRSAMGRAWAAHLAPREFAVLCEQIRASDAAQWRDYETRFTASVKAFGRQGFCISLGDWRGEIHAVAVPMRFAIDGETLVFNCGVPSLHLGPGALEREIGPRLATMVRNVEQAMGLC
jgi:DNA-binding IclR family transcriptional regulator